MSCMNVWLIKKGSLFGLETEQYSSVLLEGRFLFLVEISLGKT